MTYAAQCQALEPVILDALRRYGALSSTVLRIAVSIDAAMIGLEIDVVRAAVMALWDSGKVEIRDDRTIAIRGDQ